MMGHTICFYDWMVEWMTCDFTCFSTVFQSHQDNGQMIMKAVCNEPCLWLIRFSIELGSNLRLLDQYASA